jgi:hypothetical protein
MRANDIDETSEERVRDVVILSGLLARGNKIQGLP